MFIERCFDAIFYLLKTGCQWRMLPSDFPKWENVYYYFQKVTKISGECRGIDGGKKIKGRKRHIVTETNGLLLAVKVHAANEHDSKSGYRVLQQLKGRFGRMKKIYADGELADKVKDKLGYDMEITLRTINQLHSNRCPNAGW